MTGKRCDERRETETNVFFSAAVPSPYVSSHVFSLLSLAHSSFFNLLSLSLSPPPSLSFQQPISTKLTIQGGKIMAEYVWIGGTGAVRKKKEREGDKIRFLLEVLFLLLSAFSSAGRGGRKQKKKKVSPSPPPPPSSPLHAPPPLSASRPTAGPPLQVPHPGLHPQEPRRPPQMELRRLLLRAGPRGRLGGLPDPARDLPGPVPRRGQHPGDVRRVRAPESRGGRCESFGGGREF